MYISVFLFTVWCGVRTVAFQSEHLPLFSCFSSVFSSLLLFTTCELALDHRRLQAVACASVLFNLANSCFIFPKQVSHACVDWSYDFILCKLPLTFPVLLWSQCSCCFIVFLLLLFCCCCGTVAPSPIVLPAAAAAVAAYYLSCCCLLTMRFCTHFRCLCCVRGKNLLSSWGRSLTSLVLRSCPRQKLQQQQEAIRP